MVGGCTVDRGEERRCFRVAGRTGGRGERPERLGRNRGHVPECTCWLMSEARMLCVTIDSERTVLFVLPTSRCRRPSRYHA